MKIFIRLSFFLVLFISCSEDSNFNNDQSHPTETNPLIDLTSDSHSITKPDESDIFGTKPYPFDSVSYPPIFDSIFIPLGLPDEIAPQLIKTKVVDGSVGGTLNLRFQQRIGKDSVEIDAVLTIPPDAFPGTKRIWMVLNNQIGTVWFYPHIVFNIPVRYDVKYLGLKLSSINSSTANFVYQDYDGSIQLVNYVSIDVLTDEGTLNLVAAELNHFSRYGWTR